MNVCMVGYGMMGVWHSDALKNTDAQLHTVVGRRPDACKDFAQRYGYRKWTISLDDALADPEVEVVVLCTPSEQHESQAIQCLDAGKHTLIEIPIAMSLAGAERVVSAGERSGKVYGVCHPMRFRREVDALRNRVRAGEEKLRHIAGRFFIKRLTNVGATGYQPQLERQHSLASLLPFRRSGRVPFRRTRQSAACKATWDGATKPPAFRWSARCSRTPRRTNRCSSMVRTTRRTGSMIS